MSSIRESNSKTPKGVVALIPVALAWIACTHQEAWLPEVPEGPDPIGRIDTDLAPQGIVALPDSVDPRIRAVFERYAKIDAPNGKPIHILVQAGWRADQVVRARKVLGHLLTDVPGSRLGSDKSAVANAMADRRATLVLFDDEPAMERALRGPLGEVELGMQDLRANECPVEGDPDYMRCGTRDAAFEEILHMVHDYGLRPALPDYDEAVHRANLAANEADLWDGWPANEPENHRNEYLAAIYDNYLDLWWTPPSMYEGEHLPEGAVPTGTSHFGRYRANRRSQLEAADPVGFALIEAWFPPHVTYTVDLPGDFEGEFLLRLDPRRPYTTRSHHVDKVRATGTKSVSLLGNARDNELTGGSGDDLLEGSGGDDRLVGGPGRDIGVLSGLWSDYDVQPRAEGGFEIRDSIAGRDGTDLWVDVEIARCADGEFELR